MLINFVPDEECRIAIVEDGKLEEYYQERASAQSHVSNIYKGRVTNTEPAIQAAFIDFGLERNGFLHISDLHPKYFPGKDREAFEKVGKKTARRDRPPIQKCLKRGDEVLVQVLKEGIGTKGPTLKSYLSIPGRFLVMMPDMTKLGVSRKVEDDEARRETRDILRDLKPPEEFGFIVRTAGIGQTKTDLKRDLSYLVRLWKNIEKNRKKIKRTGELYAESDLVIRTIRDVFTNDIDRIVIDDLTAARRAQDFLRVASPRTKTQVLYYDDPVPLFHRTGVEPQIDLINAREVPLPSGGALVIDQTEALVAIDVNSGKSRAARDAETNAFKTNMEAVDEICRQLRLRDMGGIVVNDLIDMRHMRHRKQVEQRMRDNLKKDRAKSRIGPISGFGLLEMTRQRMRGSLGKANHTECANCDGHGYTMSAESVVLQVMRRLALVMQRQDVARVELTISPDVAFQLLNRKRIELSKLEQLQGKPVLVRVGGRTIDYIDIAAFDNRNTKLTTDPKTNLKHLKNASKKTYRQLDDPDLPETDLPVMPAEDLDIEDKAVAETTGGDATPETSVGYDETDESAAPGKKKKRRRNRRGGRNRKKSTGPSEEQTNGASDGDNSASEPQVGSEESTADSPTGEMQDDDNGSEAGGKKKKRRRRRRGGRKQSADARGDETDDSASSDNSEANGKPAAVAEASESDVSEPSSDAGTTTKKKASRKRSRRKSTAAKKADSASDKPKEDVAAKVPAVPETVSKTTPKTTPKKKAFRKRNAPPPPGGAGYSNKLVSTSTNRGDDRP